MACPKTPYLTVTVHLDIFRVNQLIASYSIYMFFNILDNVE